MHGSYNIQRENLHCCSDDLIPCVRYALQREINWEEIIVSFCSYIRISGELSRRGSDEYLFGAWENYLHKKRYTIPAGKAIGELNFV